MTMKTERRQQAWDKTNGRCFYCGAHLIADDFVALAGLSPLHSGMKQMHVDHGMPSSRGGTDEAENAFPACEICNGEKCDKTIADYRLSKGLRTGRMPYRFFGDQEVRPDHNFLIVASPQHIGALFRHNAER
jgi:5-methylcytosine-specific restriction endonuclease McrA